jgi:hypothetical protein
MFSAEFLFPEGLSERGHGLKRRIANYEMVESQLQTCAATVHRLLPVLPSA